MDFTSYSEAAKEFHRHKSELGLERSTAQRDSDLPAGVWMARRL